MLGWYTHTQSTKKQPTCEFERDVTKGIIFEVEILKSIHSKGKEAVGEDGVNIEL